MPPHPRRGNCPIYFHHSHLLWQELATPGYHSAAHHHQRRTARARHRRHYRDYGYGDRRPIADEQSDLERARTFKGQQYAGNPDIQRGIQALEVRNILHLPAILSCRGIWCKKFTDDLLKLGTIKRRDLAVIATRVHIGGAKAHRLFNTSTSVQNWNTSQTTLPSRAVCFQA